MCDNTCAIGIATDSIKQKRSKAIDMRFHCVRDRVRQGQFIISYIKSADNIADYFTKTLNPVKHKFFMQFLAPLLEGRSLVVRETSLRHDRVSVGSRTR